MTTRNQKRNQSAKVKPSSSKETNGVDLHKPPIVALPATNSPSELAQKTADNSNAAGKQVDSPSTLKPSSSPMVTKEPATPAAARPVKNTTSNPVVRDICALKSGELKTVSPAVSKYFGIPAGPVSELDFSDPKVAEFFMGTGVAPTTVVLGKDGGSGEPVLVSGIDVAAPVPISNLETQNTTASIPPTPVVLQQQRGTSSASEVAGNLMGVDGNTAGPNPKAAGKPQSSQAASPASWAGLFKNNRVLSEDTKLSPNFVGVSAEQVILSEEDLDDDDDEKRSLIGFFNGKFPGIDAIQHIVDDWSRKCSFHRHNSGWLVFTFDNELDCDIVLKEGPYYAFHKPLVLKKMPEFFDFSDDAYSTAPVWIQLPNLPLRAWKKPALEKICSFLGTPLHVDQVTKSKTEKSFARCLVEMDVSKELPTLVCCVLPRGKLLKQHVLYEDTPSFCSNCKKLGHESEDCYATTKGVPSLYVVKNKKAKMNKNRAGTDLGPGIGKGKADSRPKGHPNGAGKAGAGPDQAAGLAQGISGQANGKEMMAAQASTSAPSAQIPASDAAAASSRQNAMVSGHVRPDSGGSLPNVAAAGNLGIGKDSRHLPTSSMNTAMNKTNGKTAENFGKGPGLVSGNSFGPLANDSVGNWSDEVEASNAKNNNNKKNNGKKK